METRVSRVMEWLSHGMGERTEVREWYDSNHKMPTGVEEASVLITWYSLIMQEEGTLNGMIS